MTSPIGWTSVLALRGAKVQLRGARISLRLLFRLWSKNHPRKPASRCRIHALRYEAINGSDPLPSSAIFRAQLKSQGIECLARQKYSYCSMTFDKDVQ